MEQKDFFVSYNKNDKDWAKWVAGTLEENNYTVYLQAWDISPGDDFIARMNDFLKLSKNYIAIWSNSFATSPYCTTEFNTAFNERLKKKFELFLPIRVEDIPLDPLYQTTVYIDLFGQDEESATKILLNGIKYTDNPRKKGKFPNNKTSPTEKEPPSTNKSQFPISSPTAISEDCNNGGNSSIREIVILENNRNKKGDIFNRLVYDVFHALGFCQPSFNIQKAGREIDIALYHRTEKRVALVESKAQSDKIGGSDINKFVGVLDVERRRYERDGNTVVGYYVSQSGFTETALEQERERSEIWNGQGISKELILLGPKEISRELIQGKVLCPLEKATSVIQIPSKKQLVLCEYADLLACEYGWVWVLYYSQFSRQPATHFSFVHADGNPLLSGVASKLIKKSKQLSVSFSNLIYIDVTAGNVEEKSDAREAYFKYLETELGEIQFEGMPTDKEAGAVKVNLENIFVPLSFNHEEKHKNILGNNSVKATISDVLNTSTRAAILARPGGGKSTLIRRMALAYAYPERKTKVDDNLPDHDWFPIYIRCRDLGNDANKSILEIISSIVYRAEIRQHETAFKSLVEDELQGGHVLLLIDGLDEISIEQHRIIFVNQLRTFIATYPSVHLVITSREPGFRAVAGVMASYCDQYTIADLEPDQIRKLSLKWHEAILNNADLARTDSGKVCSIILNDPRIHTLAKNPLLLTTLLFVKRWVGYLPTKRCQLYEEMIKLLLVTWNAAAYHRLDLDETEPQLAYVAYQMTKSGQAKVTRDKLEQYIIAARKALPDILGYTSITPSKFIDQVEERSSLLIQQGLDENERGKLVPSYEFSHLSFQEYLAAKAIVESWTSEPDVENTGLLSLLESHYNETQWIEVIPLAAVLSGRQVRSSVSFLLDKGETCSQQKPIRKRRRLVSMDNLAALHLANLIASEVPMSQDHLDCSIKMALAHKRDIEETYRHNSHSAVNTFTTIANSKYGTRYREIIDEVLFGNYDDAHVVNYLDAWMAVYREGNRKPTLHDILQLLNAPKREDNICGAHLLMQYAFELSHNGITAKTKYKNRSIYEKIYLRILEMLKSEDELSVFCAVWSIAWSGYNFQNIYPDIYIQDTAEKLIELWLTESANINLRRQTAWAICSICKPQLVVTSTPELKKAIEASLVDPQNDYDDRAALYLGIICRYWSREETQKLLDSISDSFMLGEKRLLEDFGYKVTAKNWKSIENE